MHAKNFKVLGYSINSDFVKRNIMMKFSALIE